MNFEPRFLAVDDVDGNKRAGIVSGLAFLALNGHAIAAPSTRRYDAMIAIAERRMDKPALAALFRELAR